ncbi:Protein phosphatase 2C (PP2C)-like domain [Macleaya cordata]|uniref:Protein phosphatase 2C (PP2C)-like domain n=1 Tax=Macleaya cordata TaxID=56857 RepID=A0A200Q4I2_MACCD|nr:Protein phosphatase 2C (PP2C)-like domain [Macleaya cordata]
MREGGVPAVFQSPKCPRWSLSNEAFQWRMENCQSARLQGRRNYQEDRTFCALDMKIPFPGRTGIKEVTVGIVAVFDGHRGAEASEMASQLLLEYFFLHVYFLIDGIYSAVLEKSTWNLLYEGDVIFQELNHDTWNRYGLDLRRTKWMFSEIFDGSFHMEILKESLLRAIHDIDAIFTKAGVTWLVEAFKNNLDSGSTAAIVLIVDGQILVANIGDSKALLCSERFLSAKEAKELTRDHHPDRDDERSRVEAAGGYVLEWNGVHRVNGELAVSRTIGDVSFKSYGVISAPEVTDWQPLIANDTYLVAASDGVFEKMTTQDICDLLWDVYSEKLEHLSSCSYSLADCIVKTAFEKGSMDNLAAVVVPLRSTSFS